MKTYPDIKKILEAKREHRRLLARLPFEKKVEMAFKLKERDDFIRSSRPTEDRRDAE